MTSTAKNFYLAAFTTSAVLGGGVALAQDGESGAGDLQRYRELPFTLEHAADRIVPVDMDGDGLKDLLTAEKNRLSIYFQRGDGDPFRFASPDAVLDLPGAATGWAIDDGPDRNGGKRLLALVDGSEVKVWTIEDRALSEPDTLLERVPGFLPAGAYPVNFVRDINGDKRNDLIVPGRGELHLYLQGEEGGYGNGLRIQSRMYNSLNLNSGEALERRVGQRVRIPDLSVRDVNNDQRNDLIASSDEQVEVFIANERGHFPARPSYAIDLGELQERVGEVDVDNVDYSNLSGLLAHTYNIQLEDVDGDGIDDLLVREGGKLTLFGGTATGMNRDEPRQVLKSGGNVLGTTLRDEDDDGLKDLWLIRVEDVSLANLFLWLAVSGSIDIESFVYKNQGQRFASRPHRKLTVSIKFPSILRSMDMVTSAMEPETDRKVVRTVRAQLAGPSRRDIVVLRQEALAVFLEAVEEGESERFLGLPDYRPDKDNYVFDMGKVLEKPISGREGNLEKVAGHQPTLHIDFPEEFAPDLDQADLFARDLNGDGRDDFFVMAEREENRVHGLLLLSR